MNTQKVQKFVESQLKDLDVPKGSRAYSEVYENAVEAAEILTKKELIALIEAQLELLPNSYFQD